MENIRRRAAKDVENARKFALERFAGDLLPGLGRLGEVRRKRRLRNRRQGRGRRRRALFKLLTDTLRKKRRRADRPPWRTL